MSSHVRANLWLLGLTVLLCSVLYPLVLLGVGQAVARHQADGSLLTDADGKTFRWHGKFEGDMGRAQTLSVDLGVFSTFTPKVPAAFASTPYVLLGNIHPATQAAVLDQLKGPKFVMLDTMNLWIGTQRDGLLKLLPRVDTVCINFEEALQLADTTSGAKAVRKILDLGAKSLIMKRGNMLPPSDDIVRMTIVEMPDSCWRDRHSVASTSPNAAAAAAVNAVIT